MSAHLQPSVVTSVDRNRLDQTCRRFGIAELAVFGSEARGSASQGSDVDLLYVLRTDRTLGWEIFQLEDELAALFGRPVDLVSLEALHPLIRQDVLADAVVIYAA